MVAKTGWVIYMYFILWPKLCWIRIEWITSRSTFRTNDVMTCTSQMICICWATYWVLWYRKTLPISFGFTLLARENSPQFQWRNLEWASYQIRTIAGCACAGDAGNVFPTRRLQRKPLVSDPDMHHGTCVMHVPWCMSGSLTCGGGENVPGIPGACAPAILRICQEAPDMCEYIKIIY